jgi:cytoskeleton protein RodZ
MTFEELGAALSAERKKRNLSIEDVAENLKIGARLLRALEEGDASSLPHRAYAKGFIRVYSSYLGLAAEEVSEAVDFLGGGNTEIVRPVYRTEPSSLPKAFKWTGGLLVALLLCGGGYMVWRHGALETPDSRPRRLAAPSPAQPQAQSPAQTQTPAQSPLQPAISPSIQQPAQPVGTEQPRTTVEPLEQAVGQRVAQPPAQNAEAGAAAPADVRAAPTGSLLHKIIITATEECWIHSNADSTETRQFSLRKGETFALTFSKKLEIKLGNAGGVRVRYDGEDMPVPGQSGQVRTLIFPPAERQ